MWEADPIDAEWPVFLLRALDENEQETGAIAGVEIIGFLDFDRWAALPKLPMLWQLSGQKRLMLEELLKDMQGTLRAEATAVRGSTSAG